MKTVFRSMSKREWVFITILFILSWLIPNVQSDDYLTPEMGVEIRQVNFDYEKAPWSNSSWGQIVVDVLSLVENTQLKQGYLNILSPLGWHLVNMPIVLEQIGRAHV